MNKKGQLVVFIIAGIVILIAAILVFYATRQKTTSEIELKIPGGSVSKTALQQYVEGCLEESVAKGIHILGIQGGYIRIPPGAQVLEVKDKKNRVITEKGGRKWVELGLESNAVPYWVLDNRVDFPTLEYMEKELKVFVEKETMVCLDDFRLFREQDFEVEYGGIEAAISMDKAVNVDASLPIKAKRGDETISIDRFLVKAPVNMKLLHETAINIAANEAYFAFIEDATNNLINLYSGVDPNKLPPTAATITNLDCGFVRWQDEPVKRLLKRVLKQGMGYLRIKETNFEPIEQGIMQSFVYDTGLSDIDVNVEFEYRPDEWDLINYDVKPKTGEGINKPDKMVSASTWFIPRFCKFKYRHKYDVEYPVLVTITDPNSEEIDALSNKYTGKGFSFNVPLWIVIYGNQKRVDSGKPDVPEINESMLEESGYIETLFCDDEQRVSEEVNIKVVSAAGTLRDVDVYYYCGSNDQHCYIGRTNSAGELKTKFPLCYNGFIKFFKNEYSDKEELFSTLEIEEKEIVYEIERENSMGYSVRVISAEDFIEAYKTGADVYSKSEEFIDGERAMIMLRGNKVVAKNYPDIDENKIDISTGEYNADVYVYSKLTINPSTLGGVEISYNPEGGVYDQSVMVGVSNDVPFSLGKEDDGKELVFFVIADDRAGDTVEALDLQDFIFNEKGDAEINLLYDSCNGKIIGAAGAGVDFEENECKTVEHIIISKEKYNAMMKPRII